MAHPNSLYSSRKVKRYAALADVYPFPLNDNSTESRAIRCGTVGTLVLRFPDGTTESCDFAAGETRNIAATGMVLSGSVGCVPVEIMY